MVTVSPSQGEAVKITVKRAGREQAASGFAGSFQGTGYQGEDPTATPSRSRSLSLQRSRPRKSPPRRSSRPRATTRHGLLKSQKEKLSYALGMNLGNGIRKQSLEVDHDLVDSGSQGRPFGRQDAPDRTGGSLPPCVAKSS